MLTAALGADRALSLLIERGGPEEWRAALGEEYASELSAADIAAALERWQPRLVSRTVVAALKAAARFEARLLVPGDPLWPGGLYDLGPHAPLALWVRGTLRAVDPPSGGVAIVGSRDATNYGEHVAMELASGLSDRGFAVISGAAYGIDGMAHRAALASGGTTVAFLAGGVDRLYPAAHHDLLLRVAADGAVVSELPCGSAPTKWRFLQRNRLIAAVSRATVVVEAGRRSGSLNTAGHAAALGRPLGAVPGPVTSATSAGCHRLLREFDATCVTGAGDVVELVLGPSGSGPTLFDPQLQAAVSAPAPSPAAVAHRPPTRTAPTPIPSASIPPSPAPVPVSTPSDRTDAQCEPLAPAVDGPLPGADKAALATTASGPPATVPPRKTHAKAPGMIEPVPSADQVGAGGADAAVAVAADTVTAADATAGMARAAASAADGASTIRVIDALSRRSPRSVTDIAARSGLSVRAVRSALGILGLDGRVRESASGWRRA